MASKKKKSAKRLSTSDLKESLKGQTFFIDRCSGEAISKVFVDLELSFELHDDLFNQLTQDVEWIAYCGAEKRIIITSDKRISKNQIELTVLMNAKVCAFFFTNVDWNAQEKEASLLKALPKMTNMILNERRSFIGRISKDGSVQRWYNHKGVNFLKK